MNAPRLADERGAGVISSVWGVLIFFIFLFMAVHVLTYLYATSRVEAAAYDAARRLSGEQSISAAEVERQVVDILGTSRSGIAVRSSRNLITTRVTVTIDSTVPPLLRDLNVLERIERTVVLRTERSQ